MSIAPTLVVMAAGIGSRYGGLKQVDPIGPGGEIILDYAVFDALRAGFAKVVFIIRKDLEEIFREKVGEKIERRVETEYVFQSLEDLPAGFHVPQGRKKPWGTGHAVLTARRAVHTPFAVINADDFYGPGAFHALASFLREAKDAPGEAREYCMVGYPLRNTLSEHGTVARGICQVSPDGYLIGVQERTKIRAVGGAVKYTEDGEQWVALPEDSLVSLNTWGFTPGFFQELEARFPAFLARCAASLDRAEYFLPEVVNELLAEGKARVRVLPVQEKWFGVTHPEDRPLVVHAVRSLVQTGVYPESLW